MAVSQICLIEGLTDHSQWFLDDIKEGIKRKVLQADSILVCRQQHR